MLFLLTLLACDPGEASSDDGVEYLVLTDDEGACEDTAVDFWFPDVSEESICELWCCNGESCREGAMQMVEGAPAVYCTSCSSSEVAEVHCISVESP